MSHEASRFRVLVVCTGNTCRSPLAEAALRSSVGPDERRIEVLSAGTGARDGEPASAESVELARRAGLDVSGHRSRRLDRELANSADLVLVMERSHIVSVRAMGVDPGRIHVLSEWPRPGEPDLPVSDPFGGSLEAYEECWSRIRRHIERATPAIQEAVRARSV